MSHTAFLLAALLAVLLALAFVLVPLLQGSPKNRILRRRLRALDELADELDSHDYQARRQRLEAALADRPDGGSTHPGLILGLVVAIPLAAWLLYQSVGEPAGITRGDTQVEQIREVLIDLARQIERQPDDIDNWVRLALLYKDLREYSSAEHAFRRALYLDPDNGFIQVELAETLLFASQGSRLPEESRQLLASAVRSEPDNQKGLWLLGIGAFQGGDYEQALGWWQQLDRQLEPGSVRDSVREQIQRARIRLTEPGDATSALPPGHPPLTEPPAAEAEPGFRVNVTIDARMAENLTGRETVFLIARAAQGPAAPLAVRRLQVGQLPTSVVLRDEDGMVDGLTLSAFPQIMVTARVSMAGTAEARTGDLEGQAGPLSILEVAEADVQIDSVVR